MTSLPPSNGKLALITGINGFIASTIGIKLLEKGYSLRGTSRSAHSVGGLLRGAYKPYVDAGRVEAVQVPDMTVAGAFDESVRGTHLIFHTASPINFHDLNTWDHFVGPAVAGVKTALASALAHAGPQLETFVVTSSVASIIDPVAKSPTHFYTEDDWNNYAEVEATKAVAEGHEARVGVLYAGSKAAAEKAVWKFRDQNNPPFAISAVNPGVVLGPPVNLPASPSSLNETLLPIWDLFSGTATSIPPPIGSGSYVDVRDVATIHIWAAEHPSRSNGQRYLASAGKAPPQAIADILRETYPHRADKIPRGNPGEGYGLPGWTFPEDGIKVYGNKIKSAIGNGWEYIPFDKSLGDTVTVFERYL